jgi:predicted negative regulator of RcsB-dependent stress response
MESTVMMAKLLEALAWLKANLKNVIIGAIIVIVVGGGLGMFIYNRSQREVRASQALSEVATPMSPLTPALPGQVEAYLKVAKDYPGSKAAARAIIEAASVYYVEGNYVKAQDLFQRELKEYPDSLWRSQADWGIAVCLEQQGKVTDAIAKFEKIRNNPNAPEADDAKLRLGTLYEGQGKRVEALKLYDELLQAHRVYDPRFQSFQYDGLGSEAGVKLEDLTNRFPALGTNLVSATPPSMPQIVMTNRPTPRVIASSNLPPRTGTNAITVTNMAPKAPVAAPSAAPATPVPTAPAGTNAAK